MPATIHTVKFERNTRLADFWRASCSCGWCRVGTREEVQGLAAGHDVEWETVDLTEGKPEVIAGDCFEYQPPKAAVQP